MLLLLEPYKLHMSDTLSGKLCIKILCRTFGFFLVSQKGSQVKLKRKSGNKTFITIIPPHRELSPGTLQGILKLAEVDEEEFYKLF